jgi:ubiquinone/menaquinone biosynthesis C-methylase UbiE
MTSAAYDAIAAWYDDAIRRGSLLHDLIIPHLADLIGEIQGQRVCDLGCGQGVIARQLARQGAQVVGMDLSAELLAIARRDEEAEPLGIVYVHDDAQALATVADAAFDGVLCNMALVDIPDLDAALQSVQRILRPEGWFVFTITHPCFQTPASWWEADADGTTQRVVRAYFDEGFWRSDNPHGVRGQVGAYHRTLSTYVNALAEANLVLERLLEPQATGHIAERLPGYAEVPAVLLARCRKV